MRRALLLAVICLGVAGCRHKPAPILVPSPPLTQIPLVTPPEPASPPLVAQLPMQTPPQHAVKLPKKVRRVKKKVIVVTPTVVPVQVAVAGPVLEPASVIGALTAGGDAAPEKKQKASGLIAELNKRLAGLPVEMQEKQRDGLVRVRYFERQAREALASGDGDGAVTLVTKALLLLDDLVK